MGTAPQLPEPYQLPDPETAVQQWTAVLTTLGTNEADALELLIGVTTLTANRMYPVTATNAAWVGRVKHIAHGRRAALSRHITDNPGEDHADGRSRR